MSLYTYRIIAGKSLLHQYVDGKDTCRLHPTYEAETFNTETGFRVILTKNLDRNVCKQVIEAHKARERIASLERHLEVLRQWNALGDTTAAEHTAAVSWTIRKLATTKTKLEAIGR